MSVLDCWENSYEMFVKDPNGEVTDFKIKLDVSFEAFEKLTLSEDMEEDIDKMVGKLKPIILGWDNLVDDGVPVLCTEENKERILKMYWILEQVLYTHASIMSQYCKIKSIENDANDFIIDLKRNYNINQEENEMTNVTAIVVPVEQDQIKINGLAQTVFEQNKANGWWTNIETGESLESKKGEPPKRNIPEMLMLVVSEVVEGLEGHRKNLMDDKLPHRPMLEVELADAVIRILDMCGGLGLDLQGAIYEKLAYNAQRADHKVENRLKENGKKF